MLPFFRSPILLFAVLVTAWLAVSPLARAASTIEYLDGTRFECKVLSKDETNVTVEVTSGGMIVKRTIPLAKVHKVTINGKSYVINNKPTADAAQAGRGTNAARSNRSGGAEGSAEGATGTSGSVSRTRAEVDALINQLGKTPPDWYDAAPSNYPTTLDLSWPIGPPPGGWNNQKNVGQYIWDIINPNPNKWREGIKLLHQELTLHKDDPARLDRDMEALARMYHNLHQDYARAAFWWRKAGVDRSQSPPGAAVHLAECYWRLGNKPMAVEYLRKLDPAPYDAIKLWADMGQTQQALQIAASAANSGSQPHFAYLYAADACRVAGRHKEALDFYQKVVAVPSDEGNKGQIERCHQRATASIEAIKLYDLSDVKKVADGTYQASAVGYEGPVHVEVAVQTGRLELVRVTQHKEKQFYSAMTDTPAKIIAKQGVKGVDATSSATITSEAIINATAKALASGAK